jgi:ribosomal protein S18 acetylase RimI-like enzyme
MELASMLTRIQNYLRLRATFDSEVIFRSLFDFYFRPGDLSIQSNYAIPCDPMPYPHDEALSQIYDTFDSRYMTPHVKMIAEIEPGLVALLESARFVVHEKMRVMVCTADALRFPPDRPDLSIQALDQFSPLALIREMLDVNTQGFNPDSMVLATDEEAERFRRMLVKGRGFTARLWGSSAVGGGMYTDIEDGITELVGISTLLPFRRLGIAAHVTAYMTRVAFAQGADLVFLIAVDDYAARMYQRVGFRPCGTFVSYLRENDLI